MGRVPMRLPMVVLLMVQLLVATRVVHASDLPLDQRDRLLQQAIEHSLEAEFDQSLALFDKLLGDAELDQRRLVLLLSERSLVLYALGKQEALDDNLHRLARVEPNAALSERAPPPLVTRWQTISATARQEQSAQDLQPALSAQPAEGVAIPLAPVPDDSRRKRAFLIGGAVLTAAATLVVALVLTVPSSSPASRSSVQPSVEF
jgi:tetratricopeptide (TPR) repeat protein